MADLSPDAERRPRVSVIAPAHDNAEEVERFLAALAAQTAPAGLFEVIVADDHSSDSTAEVVERHPIARLVRLTERGGSYVARNAGLAVARGELLAFVDSDCVPDPDWVLNGIAALERTAADIVAGHLLVPIGDRPTLGTLFEAGRYYDQSRYASNGYSATGNLWTRRSVIDRFGPFNDRLTTGGDKEFGVRVSSSGGTVAYAADVVVRHDPRHGLRDVSRKEYRLGFQAAQHLYHSHSDLRGSDLLCAHPRSYLPRTEIAGLDRLERQGFRAGRAKRLQMATAQYLYLRLPFLAGNIAGVLKERRLPPRVAAEAVEARGGLA